MAAKEQEAPVRAIVVSKNGGPEVLAMAELPDPEPGPGEVVVDVAASGVNFADIAKRTGRMPEQLPFIPGHEAAGIVSSVGSRVSGVTVGDRVGWAWPGVLGGYAERVAVPAQWIVPLPPQIELSTAAAVLIQGLTAHYLSHAAYQVNPGDTVLVHAAAGGVGSLLTQMVKLQGGRVIGTVSTAAKEEFAREAGADEVIRYTDVDFAAEVKRFTEGAGVAAVFDNVGHDTFDGSLASLAPRGVLAIYGQVSGPVPVFETARLIAGGSQYLTRTSLVHYVRDRDELLARVHDLFGWVVSGELTVHVSGQYPLADARSAHQELENRRTTGKLLLIP
jgi:NADPH2:quinone reductase